eukprot:g11570.t1
MAEFGAKLCSEPGCRQHDFLPWTCSACGRVFCQVHMAIGSGHRCDAGEAYLASRRDEGATAPSASAPTGPPATRGRLQPSSASVVVPKPSEVMFAVSSRFGGREDELNATVTHFNIKASGAEAGEGNAGAPDKRLRSTQLAMETATTDKGKRVSAQVHRMLLKAKAVGDKKLRIEDRYFLEVHYCGNDTDVHHLFFSRLWTVGRTLDEILKTRRRHLRLEPGKEGRPLELTRVGAPGGLPTGAVLHNLPPDQLQSFDAVTIRPRAAAPAGSSNLGLTTPAESPATVSVSSSGGGCGYGEVKSENATVAEGGDLDGDGERVAERVGVGASDDASAATAVAGVAATTVGGRVSEVSEEEGGMTIMIGHGKAVYELGGVVPDRVTVLDIKRRLEPITGVPFSRQKLLFKGILRDGDKIGSTKIVDGAKVMLLGAAAAAAKK